MRYRLTYNIKKGEEMKKIMIATIFAAICFAFVSPAVSAAEPVKEAEVKAGENKTVPAAGDATQEPAITKEEILSRLNNVFTYHPNIAGGIKGLETKQDASGNPYFLLNGVKLEDLDQKTLLGILGIANQQVSLENLQRIQQQERQARSLRQLNQMNQINRVDKNQQVIRQQQNISRMNTPKTYSPSKTYTPPKTYKPPAKY